MFSNATLYFNSNEKNTLLIALSVIPDYITSVSVNKKFVA